MPQPAPRTADTAARPTMRRRGRSSYRLLDPAPLPLLSQPHCTAPVSQAIRNALEDRYMKREGNELPRIPIPRTPVNKDKKQGRSPAETRPFFVRLHLKELSHGSGGPYVLVYAGEVSRVVLILYGN